ncbi:MAG: metallophosphoesterase [Candidatus Nanohaloarchaea archaeon]
MSIIISIADIHGNYSLAKKAVEDVAERAGFDNFSVEGSANVNAGLVVLGDAFDRGPENEKSLDFALAKASGRGVYLAGNHEFFVMFPDVSTDFLSSSYLSGSDSSGLYWRYMSESKREKLLEAVAAGNLKATHDGENYSYVHAGAPKTDNKELNNLLLEAGEKLLSAHQQSQERYEEVQREIMDLVETENGRELESERYGDLFRVCRNSKGNIEEGGAVWRRFKTLPEDSSRQVIGHTKIASVDTEDIPPSRGQTLNINSIRDYKAGRADGILISVERPELFQILQWNHGNVEEVFREEF